MQCCSPVLPFLALQCIFPEHLWSHINTPLYFVEARREHVNHRCAMGRAMQCRSAAHAVYWVMGLGFQGLRTVPALTHGALAKQVQAEIKATLRYHVLPN